MAQNRNNQRQGGGQQAGTSSRRTLALEILKEEQVEGGVRALLQARVAGGRKAGDNEPLTLVVAGVSMEFGGFFEPASGLAHWERFVPSGEEHVFQVVDEQGNVSLPKRVSAKAPSPSTKLSWEGSVIRKDGTFHFEARVRDAKEQPVADCDVLIIDPGVGAPLYQKTNREGVFSYEATPGAHLRKVEISVIGTELHSSFHVLAAREGNE